MIGGGQILFVLPHFVLMKYARNSVLLHRSFGLSINQVISRAVEKMASHTPHGSLSWLQSEK
jgi:hypothetical protein